MYSDLGHQLLSFKAAAMKCKEMYLWMGNALPGAITALLLFGSQPIVGLLLVES